MLLKTVALVLQESNVNDNDKRLVLLTKEAGRVVAFANGAKRQKSPLLAGSQVFSFSDFQLYKGKNTYSIRSIDLIDSFYGLRQSMEQMALGLYLCELTKSLTDESFDQITSNTQLLRFLYTTFKQVEKNVLNHGLIQSIFELKVLQLEGYAPQLQACSKCGQETIGTGYRWSEGGVVCPSCQRSHDHPIPGALLALLQELIQRDYQAVYHLTVEDGLIKDFKNYMEKLIPYTIDYPFKTRSFLRQMGAYYNAK